MSLSRLIRTIQLALKSLMLHKLRSGLTMLGIVFGVFSVIAMLAIGEGASNQAQQQVLELGATNIIVVSVKPPDTAGQTSGNQRVLRYGLKREEYDVILRTIPTVSSVIPVRESRQEARFLHRTLNSRLVGCTADYEDVNRLKLARGRFLTDRDQQVIANVAVIAHEVRETLFPFEDPIGKEIQIKNAFYTVVGVTAERTASAAIGGSMSGQDYNKDVYIPLKTFDVQMGNLDIQVTAGSFNAEQVELNQITMRVDKKEDVLKTADVVRETLMRKNPKRNDIAVVVPLELLKQAEQIRNIFNVVLGSIAAISLVVGGIGIMNIMLATVTERTREIGIRRALGAKQKDIIQQFLTETVVLSGTGGLIGVAMGLLTPVAFMMIKWIVNSLVLEGATASSELGRMFSEMSPQIAFWSLPLAFGFSVAIGIIFGIYPARAAAKLDPIEALRHE